MEYFQKARKTKANSIYNQVDTVLSKYKIKMTGYHLGSLSGVCIIHLMGSSAEIMSEIIDILLADKSKRCTLSNNKIRKMCQTMDNLLSLWDGALS